MATSIGLDQYPVKLVWGHGLGSKDPSTKNRWWILLYIRWSPGNNGKKSSSLFFRIITDVIINFDWNVQYIKLWNRKTIIRTNLYSASLMNMKLSSLHKFILLLHQTLDTRHQIHIILFKCRLPFAKCYVSHCNND